MVSNSDKKNSLQLASYELLDEQSFYGNLLQEFVIKYSPLIPTAAFTYNKKLQQFEILLGEEYFCTHLDNSGRKAVLHHEVLHFTHEHMTRFFENEENPALFKIKNIAADMAINQLIRNMPADAVNINNWKNNAGKLFEKFQTAEYYYELIKKESKEDPKGNVGQQMDKYVPFDDHKIEELTQEEKQKLLETAQKMLKRTIEKCSFDHTSIPENAADMLHKLDTALASLNYKQILKSVIKKSTSGTDREPTYSRPSKRYGMYSPGTKIGMFPQVHYYGDTSGSISHTELNQFFQMMEGFFKVGARDCFINLWHTDLYKSLKYKKGFELNLNDLQSGGTNIQPVMEHIAKHVPDLAIVYTDGYFDATNIIPQSEVIWIITEQGNVNHPMTHVGRTIPLGKIK